MVETKGYEKMIETLCTFCKKAFEQCDLIDTVALDLVENMHGKEYYVKKYESLSCCVSNIRTAFEKIYPIIYALQSELDNSPDK